MTHTDLRRIIALLAALCTGALLAAERVSIPAGEYRPLFASATAAKQQVAGFQLDRLPVSNQQFATFVSKAVRWQPERINPLFADEHYLQHWQKNATTVAAPRPEELQAPVTNVSWFAAKAYCQAQGGRLPTTAEWEYVASAGSVDPQADEKLILGWYSATTPAFMPAAGQRAANAFGVHDLHGLIWEWTQDFSASMTTGESRGDSALDNQFFCGSAAAGSADPSQYAAFMRYALRSSLQGRYTVANLGFRCAYSPSSLNAIETTP
ncbi:formylglycine-generating enzyme family protein [Permianibacter sp. IMCC34836]|uniref:formylglycine-generating enzyme family protein n=1 Tax=Permianibacter fluminis TaxID=2738515 RepID=UPI001554DA3F|nr:formylglycine-generating enzyme family protein [Permianibacter fluminis]NQD37902.1 formylglycine-generating enzyme family protein [Permianibacter fluminis]